MSNYYAPHFNRINIVAIPSYIELPWAMLKAAGLSRNQTDEF